MNLLQPWMNEGLLISTGIHHLSLLDAIKSLINYCLSGDKWRSRRRMLNQAFTVNILAEFVKTFAENTDRLMATLKAEARAQSGDVVKELYPLFSKSSLDIICGEHFHVN